MIKWQDPPAEAGRKFARKLAYEDETAVLRAEPGRWALLDELTDRDRAHRLVDNIHRGNLAAFRPPGSFEARSLGTKVWARYVGTEGQK